MRLEGIARAALAIAALVGTGGTVYLRLAPSGLEVRKERFLQEASEALQRDAVRMARLAVAIQGSRDFAAIVDGGGAEVRPSRLFTLLERALPHDDGWGAVYRDSGGRAVAWAGETGSPDTPPAAEAGQWRSSFHVTRFSVVHRSPRVAGRETRGVLVVGRSYPTGILRPDLIRFLSLQGGPTRLRLRATAPSGPGALIGLHFEQGPREVEEDDSARSRARPFAILASASFLGLALFGRWPAVGIVAARLILVPGSPLADRGIWMPLLPSGYDWRMPLVGTPADLLLTGVCSLLLVRLAFGSGAPRTGGRTALRLACLVGGLALAPIPFLLVRQSAGAGLLPGGGLDLVPDGAVPFCVRTGGIALSSGLLVGAALLFSFARVPVRPLLGASAGILLLLGSVLLPGGTAAPVLASVAAVLLAMALSRRMALSSEADFLGRLSTAIFALAAGALVSGAGLADGRYCHLDSLLARAEVRSRSQGERETEELPARWEGRLSRPSLRPWLPAGDRTGTTDLARALWVRGADGDYPRADDLLTIRDSQGNVTSSFGLVRPGADRRGTSFLTELPLEGFSGVFTRLDSPTQSDRDPVLSSLVEDEVGPRLTIERIDYDVVGRPSGAGGERPEIPEKLLAEVRRDGRASGNVERAGATLRIHLRASGPGFVAHLVPAEGPLVLAGAAVAAGEGGLPFLLPLLLAANPRGRRRTPGRELFRQFRPTTFRARLVVLLFLSSALPLAGSVFAIRAALDRNASVETKRHSINLLTEARRALETSEEDTPSEYELNAAAAVLGTDLLLYRDGRLLAASRALPVAAGVAGERLPAVVAEALAEGKSEASAVATHVGRRLRAVEAAVPLGRNPRETIAVVVVEDAAARAAVDGLVLFAVGAALAAFGLGVRAALTLSRPIEDVTKASRRIGSGEAAGPIDRPRAADLAELVEAFEGMAAQVRERTELLARERAAAVGLLSNLTAAVLLFRERDGEVLLANPKAEQILPGRHLGDRLAQVVWEPLRTLLEKSRGAKEPMETRIAVRQGESDRVFHVVVAPLPSEGDERRSALLLEDLTGFVRAERLTAWVEAAKAIAHDIKNPLTPIRLSAERLLRPGRPSDGGRIEDAAATILRQVGVLTERIGRLGRFSDPARHPGTLDAAGLAELLREIAADFSPSPGIRLQVDLAQGLPDVIADREPLRDALTNLVVNSIEAIGSRGGTIRLSASVDEDQPGRPVRITCSDDGPGVGETDLERIFDPSFSTKSRGSGMGLAAARRAIEGQSGSVLAERNPGGGLSISFRLLSR